jgi:hypothetical protein
MPSIFKPLLSKEELPKKVQFEELPADIKLKRGEWFCPYCGSASKFIDDKFKGCKRCSFCGISEDDYYVKMLNHLWGNTKVKRKESK